jgi:hypothetical protein
MTSSTSSGFGGAKNGVLAVSIAQEKVAKSYAKDKRATVTVVLVNFFIVRNTT